MSSQNIKTSPSQSVPNGTFQEGPENDAHASSLNSWNSGRVLTEYLEDLVIDLSRDIYSKEWITMTSGWILNLVRLCQVRDSSFQDPNGVHRSEQIIQRIDEMDRAMINLLQFVLRGCQLGVLDHVAFGPVVEPSEVVAVEKLVEVTKVAT